MTTDELASYYADLLILQYLQKPKAYAHVKALVTPALLDQVPFEARDAFDIVNAKGQQLDVIGKYVGVSRVGKGLARVITLDDIDFRTLIKLVSIKNNAGSSLGTIQDLLYNNFPGLITVSDNQTMQISYVLSEAIGTSDLLEMIVVGGFLPRPMGVQISVVIVPSLDTTYFGFRDYSNTVDTVAPFNSYNFYQTDNVWLSYSGVL